MRHFTSCKSLEWNEVLSADLIDFSSICTVYEVDSNPRKRPTISVAALAREAGKSYSAAMAWLTGDRRSHAATNEALEAAFQRLLAQLPAEDQRALVQVPTQEELLDAILGRSSAGWAQRNMSKPERAELAQRSEATKP